MTTEAISVGVLSEKDQWIGKRDIERVSGALKPCAYVARAYKFAQQNHGSPPSWARKLESSQWLFLESYIRSDARINTETMSVHEAAVALGATRRAIQDWVDNGDIPVLGGENREKGEERRIVREAFMRDIPRFKKRLETAAVVARKLNSGYYIPDEVLERTGLARRRERPPARRSQPTGERRWNAIESVFPAPVTESASSTITETTDARVAAQAPAEEKLRILSPKEKAALALESRLSAAILGVPEPAAAAGESDPKAAAAASAAQLEAKLVSATQVGRIEKDAGLDRAKEKKAAATALETKLKSASALKLQKAVECDPALEKRAVVLAQRIQEEMFEQDLSLRRSVIQFIQEAISQGIPANVRLKICKRIFGT